MIILTRITTLLVLVSISLNAIAQTPLKVRDASIKGSQTFAIVLGVSKYKYVRPLAYADKDAILFKDYLKSPGGGSVKDENIFMLLNEKASNANFWGKGFQWLKAKNLQRGDKLFIYLAGHGDAIDEDQFFFLGYDCNPAGDKNNYLVSGAIQLFNLKKKIANETTKGVEVFFIMDACRSNELPGGASGQNFLNSAISEKKAGEIIMLATAAGQESLEDASIGTGQGLFTYYLVDGLNGVADSDRNPDGKISFTEIQNHVNKNVPSIAQQRFRRKQDPYFCCNENSDKIISNVDTAYLRKWLQKKKQETRRGGGNSFSGFTDKQFRLFEADTLLTETYERFNRAVENKNITGNSSAEEFFQQLNTKFPGNPYTLDAKSTLAVEYINEAQARVDRYLICGDDASDRIKRENTAAADHLEKAIAMVREDDADFANSLLGRMYLLRAGGNNTDVQTSLRSAYGALAIDPNGAYIQHKLAQLHLSNKNNDSALYYADKAVKTAPNWACALTTLALVRNAANKPTENNNNKPQSKKPVRKSSFGGVTGAGLSQLTPTFSADGQSTITGVNPRDILKADLGIIYQIGLSSNISIRPSTVVSMEGGELIYERRPPTGGQVFRDTVSLKNTSVTVALPVIIHLSNKKIAPYISLGPSFTYMISQEEETSTIVPVKKSVLLGDAAFGVDIGLGKSRLMISPELRYTQGFNNLKGDGNGEFSRTISSLKKRGITFSIYLRGR